MADLRYLLWANDKQMWWRTDGWGYTPSVDEAGRFTEDDAMRYVVQSAHAGRLDAATVMVVDTKDRHEHGVTYRPGLGFLAHRAECATCCAMATAAYGAEPTTDAQANTAALGDKAAEVAGEGGVL